MKFDKRYLMLFVGLSLVALLISVPTKMVAANEEEGEFVTSSSLLAGLAPGAAFPIIDTTPHAISTAHVAITDATTNCSPGADAPSNVRVLVGNAGAVPPVLVSVMGASTNLGISTTPGQCVFHATIKAGQGGIPSAVTYIVVLNGGSSPLTGINTVTASARVSCNLGNLVNRGYAVVGIAVKVTGGAGTTITNTASVGASTFDPTPNDNSASVSTAVAQTSPDD